MSINNPGFAFTMYGIQLTSRGAVLENPRGLLMESVDDIFGSPSISIFAAVLGISPKSGISIDGLRQNCLWKLMITPFSVVALTSTDPP